MIVKDSEIQDLLPPEVSPEITPVANEQNDIKSMDIAKIVEVLSRIERILRKIASGDKNLEEIA